MKNVDAFAIVRALAHGSEDVAPATIGEALRVAPAAKLLFKKGVVEVTRLVFKGRERNAATLVVGQRCESSATHGPNGLLDAWLCANTGKLGSVDGPSLRGQGRLLCPAPFRGARSIAVGGEDELWAADEATAQETVVAEMGPNRIIEPCDGRSRRVGVRLNRVSQHQQDHERQHDEECERGSDHGQFWSNLSAR